MATQEPPRLAATVVLLRPRLDPESAGDAFELFMVRRSSKSPFMPDALVFPGGRVDTEDGPEGSDLAHERAARRETMEEVRVDLGEQVLRWFDTWTTPSGEMKRRYRARFYLAELEAGAAEEAEADEHETHEGRWGTPAEHLADWDAERIDLPPPTLAVLMTLERASLDELRTRSLDVQDLARTVMPKVHIENNKIQVVLPHDPAYADLPGEGSETPTRVHGLPHRFVREERVWRPV